VHEQHRQNWAEAMSDCLLDITEAIDHARPIAEHLPKAHLMGDVALSV